MRTIYLFHITNSAGLEMDWWVDLKKTAQLRKLPPRTWTRAAGGKPTVHIYIGDKDLVGLASGKVSFFSFFLSFIFHAFFLWL